MRYVYRPDHPYADENGFVEAEMAGPKHASGSAVYVIGDEMAPTRHMADSKLYTSKAKFRETTKAHGCIEIGSETNYLLKPRKPVPLDRGKRREDIKQAIYNIRNGRN
jgi:hypothetical protein